MTTNPFDYDNTTNRLGAEERYPVEVLDDDGYTDDGTIVGNVSDLEELVVGHRIVKAERRSVDGGRYSWRNEAFVITLDNGNEVQLFDTDDCCAYTALESFLLHPDKVDHVILGVGTTEGYNTWHIYADWGDVLELEVGWSCGNPFYYGYGFDINVVPVEAK